MAACVVLYLVVFPALCCLVYDKFGMAKEVDLAFLSVYIYLMLVLSEMVLV